MRVIINSRVTALLLSEWHMKKVMQLIYGAFEFLKESICELASVLKIIILTGFFLFICYQPISLITYLVTGWQFNIAKINNPDNEYYRVNQWTINRIENDPSSILSNTNVSQYIREYLEGPPVNMKVIGIARKYQLGQHENSITIESFIYGKNHAVLFMRSDYRKKGDEYFFQGVTVNEVNTALSNKYKIDLQHISLGNLIIVLATIFLSLITTFALVRLYTAADIRKKKKLLWLPLILISIPSCSFQLNDTRHFFKLIPPIQYYAKKIQFSFHFGGMTWSQLHEFVPLSISIAIPWGALLFLYLQSINKKRKKLSVSGLLSSESVSD